MKRAGFLALLAILAASPSSAHFQVLAPSTDIVGPESGGTVNIDLVFTHPMARGPAMEMARPARFGVLGPDGERDLLDALEKAPVDGKTAWKAAVPVARPGGYVFFVEPKPYWEPAEKKMIVHYAKVVVDAYDWGQGWDRPVGLPVEIEPLHRPYGLWTNNVFRGIVRKEGKPVPFAEIEVEWLNDGSVEPPADAYLTQVIKADAGGVFAYAMPRAGWWGFAALIDGDEPMRAPNGEAVPVELGALIWVRARDME